MKISKHIHKLLMDALDELCSQPELYAKKPGIDFTRNRKLGLKDLLILYFTMESDTTKEELFRYFGRSTDSPKPYVLHKQRKKLIRDTFKNLLTIFNKMLDVNLLNNKYRCIAVDGSNVTLFRDPTDSETFVEPSQASARGFNQIHLNASYDIINNRYLDFVFQDVYHQNEHLAFCEMLKNYCASNDTKAIFFADRGYDSYNNYATTIENNQYFIIRCDYSHVKTYTGKEADDFTTDFDLDIKLFLTRSMAKKKWQHPDKSDLYRFVAKHTKFDYIDDNNPEYELNIRFIRITIEEGKYEFIATNLPRDEFPTNKFKEQYCLRWSVETSFRFLKHTLCINALHAKKLDNAIHEIWARAIMYNVTSAITMVITNHLRKKQKQLKNYKPEYTTALKTCREFIRGKSAIPIKVEKVIKDNLTRVVPGRSFERRKSQSSVQCFCYR